MDIAECLLISECILTKHITPERAAMENQTPFLPPNSENLLYLKPGKLRFDRSSNPGRFYFPKELVTEFLNFEISDWPNLSWFISSGLGDVYIGRALLFRLANSFGFYFCLRGSGILVKGCCGIWSGYRILKISAQ